MRVLYHAGIVDETALEWQRKKFHARLPEMEGLMATVISKEMYLHLGRDLFTRQEEWHCQSPDNLSWMECHVQKNPSVSRLSHDEDWLGYQR